MLITNDDARILREAAPGAEAVGHLAPAQLDVIERHDWFRLLAPRSLGGQELALPQAVRLEEAIAEADGSAGWVVTLGAGAGWFAGFVPPMLARAVVTTPSMCLAGSGAATGIASPLRPRAQQPDLPRRCTCAVPNAGVQNAMHKVLADGCNCPSTYSDARSEHDAERRFIAQSARARGNSALF